MAVLHTTHPYDTKLFLTLCFGQDYSFLITLCNGQYTNKIFFIFIILLLFLGGEEGGK